MNYTFAYYGGPGVLNMTALAEETKTDKPTPLTHSTTLTEMKHFRKQSANHTAVLSDNKEVMHRNTKTLAMKKETPAKHKSRSIIHGKSYIVC